MCEKKANFRVINLLDLWNIFINHFIIIIIVATIFVSGIFAYITITFVPQYKSTATLYILKDKENQSTDNISSNFNLALNLVNDCTYLLKSHAVIDEVIDELDIDIPFSELASSVSTSNPDKTRILEVTVVSDSPEKAKEITDCLCNIGSQKIKEAMGFNQVNLYEYGTINNSPCNKKSPYFYLIIWIAIAAVIYSFFVIKFLMNDGFQSSEDIEKYLGISVIGEIPNANESKKHRYSYYSDNKNTGNNNNVCEEMR